MSAQRTERLLTLVQILLGSHTGLTKNEIFDAVELYDQADSPGAQEKLFDRDKAALRELGIPISTTSEDIFFDQETATTRYRIDPLRYRLPELNFTAPQVRLLQLAASVWDDLALGESARSALRKLGIGQEANSRVGTGFGEQSAALDALTAALRDRLSVTFDYQNAAGEVQTRTVDPWGLGTRYAHWYLIGFDRDRSAERVFRLSRIRGAVHVASGRTAKNRYDIPDNFDIHQALEDITEAVPERDATLRLVPGRGHVLRAVARDPHSNDSNSTNPNEVRIPFRSEEYVTGLILGSARAVLGIEPRTLEEHVRSQLMSIADIHDAPVPDRVETISGRPQPPREIAEHRIVRLLELVPYLDMNPGVSLSDLAAEFSVTEEQIRQDLDLLFVAGPRYYPTDLIDLSIDEDGRVFVEDPQKFDRPMTFTLDEASALLAGLEALRDLVPHTAELDATQAIIAAALPRSAPPDMDEVARSARSSSEQPAPMTLDRHISAELIGLGITATYRELQEAIMASKQVTLEYLNPVRDERTFRLVDPWKLIQARGQWYLTGWCHLAGDQRTFRLDRIAAIHRESSPQDHLKSESTREPQLGTVYCTLRVLPGSTYREPPSAIHFSDGSFEATLDIFDLDWLPQLLTAHPGHIQVLAPPEARDTVSQWLSSVPLLSDSMSHKQSSDQLG